MASIKPYGSGYRAFVCVSGFRVTKTFRTRREASAWASATEDELRTGAPLRERHTVSDVLQRYAAEVSPGKRGKRWEQIRLEALDSMRCVPSNLRIDELTTAHLAAWRDARLAVVKPGTVLREIALLSAVFETARREWQWIRVNPLDDLRRPRQPDHREVLITWRQILAMLRALDWHTGPCRSTRQAVGRAFILALRTGMRAGELAKLTWSNVRDDYVILPETKTRPRNVPLTRESARVLRSMDGWDRVLVFGISAQTLDAVFRRARVQAGLAGFTFHDARHTAATMMARRIDVLDMCKVFGWRNTGQALTYYNPSASEIAGRLRRR